MLKIFKIEHKGTFKIGIRFKNNGTIKAKLCKIGAVYSNTKKCYYLDYTKKNYALILQNFEKVEIVKSDKTSQIVATNNVQPHIVSNNEIQLVSDKKINPEHTVKEITDLLRFKAIPDIGKYWVFKLNYHYIFTKELLKIKGVYWNNNSKVFMAIRTKEIKQKLETLLQKEGLFSSNYWKEDRLLKSHKITLKPHAADTNWMQVHFIPVFEITERIKRFSMAKFSKTNNCYLLPATPQIHEALLIHFNTKNITVNSELQKKYLSSKKAPNSKRKALESVKENLINQMPENAKIHLEKFINFLLAKNYSSNTIRMYGSGFIHFLRFFEHKDPKNISKNDIIGYLGELMKNGFTSSTGNNVVNALKIYYRELLPIKDLSFDLPRPKKEKKLPTVFSLDECLALFRATENPKHKLLLLMGYGAGLRVSEIVNLKWTDIHFNTYKLHIKNAKGKKDRIVMLPVSVIEMLLFYKKLSKNSVYVFEGQVTGEPYSTTSVQTVMRKSLEKIGLSNRGSVHSLRHSFATHLLENGTDVRFIQKLLGHENIKTTMVYTHIAQGEIDKIKSPLDTLVNNNNKNIK